MTDAARDLVGLLERFPPGWSVARYAGRRWAVTRTVRVGGRQQSVYAEELGGTAIVSANVYAPRDGEALLRPCEMSAERVLDFLRAAVVEGSGHAPAPDAG